MNLSVALVNLSLVGSLGAAFVLSCSSGEDKGQMNKDPAQQTDDDTTPVVPVGEALGQFDLQIQPAQAETAFSRAREAVATLQGRVWSGPRVPQTGWSKTLEEGDCALHLPVRPVCDPDCMSGEYCGVGEQCVTEPPTVSVGVVEVSGLANVGMTDVVKIEPLNATTNSYSPVGDARLLYPPVAENAAITLQAEGGALEPFTIHNTGIVPLIVLNDDELPLSAEGPFELLWESADNPDTRMFVTMNISHHGGTRGEILCETADDGALDIPAALIAELIELGVAGFPSVQLDRRVSAFANIGDHHVAFHVRSRAERLLSIPGLISCAKNEDCPDAQVCRADLTCGAME